MKLSHKQLKQIEEFAKKKIINNDTAHQLPHILRTIHISKILATKEKADTIKCIVIAWLHDIEKNKEEKGLDHGDEGAKSAAAFLEEIGLEKQDIEDIAYAIKKHNKLKDNKTIEAKIILDADRIQIMGMEGFLRTYGHSRIKGETLEEAYKTIIKEQKFCLTGFKTETGKRFAKKRFRFFKKMVNEYEKEFNVIW